MQFKALHNQGQSLLLCNVWDAPSTKIAEQLGFQAVGTSSAAIATQLGKVDGEEISFADLLSVVKNIKRNTSLPVSVDLESGYSRDPKQVCDYITQLAEIGAVGINIEDSLVIKGERSLIDAEQFAIFLRDVVDSLKQDNIEMFINVRCDVYLLGSDDPVNAAKARAKLYQNAGVDGIFLPGIQDNAEIEQLAQFIQLPLNVMSVPGLADFQTLKRVGVSRISMGNVLFDKMYQSLQDNLQSIQKDQSFAEVFNC